MKAYKATYHAEMNSNKEYDFQQILDIISIRAKAGFYTVIIAIEEDEDLTKLSNLGYDYHYVSMTSHIYQVTWYGYDE